MYNEDKFCDKFCDKCQKVTDHYWWGNIANKCSSCENRQKIKAKEEFLAMPLKQQMEIIYDFINNQRST